MNLDERLRKDLSPDIYCLVHNKIVNLEQQVKKQKEVIDKLNDLLSDEFLEVIDRDTLLDILKEVSE